MCLESITKREDEMLPEMVAYKVMEELTFADEGRRWSSQYFPAVGFVGLKQGWAMKDGCELTTTASQKCSNITPYLPGVHAFLSPEAAIRYRNYSLPRRRFSSCDIVKVRLRGPIVTGTQHVWMSLEEVVVYKEMTIIRVW